MSNNPAFSKDELVDLFTNMVNNPKATSDDILFITTFLGERLHTLLPARHSKEQKDAEDLS